ncbi:MAG: hypothetical protein ACTSQK_08825 [Candidatus Heimdallarchaeota archaeon]
MKSHLSTLSLTTGTGVIEEDFIESVIPFIDEGYVAYSTFFFVDDDTARGGKRTLGIVTLVDRSEQMSLFKSIPNISTTVKEIANDLLTRGDPKECLPDQIKQRLSKLLKMEALDSSIRDPTDSTELIKLRIESDLNPSISSMEEPTKIVEQKTSFDFLINKIPTCLDRIIHALLKNERILVVGSKEEIKLTIATLREFLPHKETYSDPWSVPITDAEALFSKSADDTIIHVLGILDDTFYELLDKERYPISETALDYCVEDMLDSLQQLPISSKIVIDYTQGKIFGGVTNQFCVKLVNSIKNVNNSRATQLINDQINHLIERVNQLSDLFLFNLPEKEQVEQFLDSASEGEISLIVSIIEDVNPKLLSRVLRYFAENHLSLEVLF